MGRYGVFGLGLMGEAICYDLLKFDHDMEVIGFEKDVVRSESIFKKLNAWFPNRFRTIQVDVSKLSHEDLMELLISNDISVAFGAIDYSFNPKLTRACIDSKVHFLDLGGNPEIVISQKKMNGKAQSNGVTVIPDCGLAPGMVNVIAAGIMEEFSVLEKCKIRVGGLPQYPKTILKYQQVFSIRGLTNEYLEDAIVIRNGKKQVVESLTEVETLVFPEPWGELEAFQTAGGTSSLPDLYEGRIQELDYKTIRFKGHVQFFQFLKEFGFLGDDPVGSVSPRKMTEFLLSKHLPHGEPDAVLVRITVVGKQDGVRIKKELELIDLMDSENGYSAMARTTAFPISIIGQMINREVITARGVVPGEIAVPKAEFLSQLKKRGIIFTEKIKKID